MSAGRFSGKRALITGASGGIGLDLARSFARDGWDLLLVSRNAPRLRAVCQELSIAHGIDAKHLSADLSVAGSAKKLFRDCEASGIRADALVNNAGAGIFGPFKDADPVEIRRILELNLSCLTELTRLFIPGMAERRFGYLLNVASTAAFPPGPLMAVYYASKAYVLSFTEALAEELRGSGVKVTVLCPGATATGFQEAAKMSRSGLFKRNVMSSEAAARAGYEGLISGKRLVIPGWVNKVLVTSMRAAPRGLVARVVRKIQEAD